MPHPPERHTEQVPQALVGCLGTTGFVLLCVFFIARFAGFKAPGVSDSLPSSPPSAEKTKKEHSLDNSFSDRFGRAEADALNSEKSRGDRFHEAMSFREAPSPPALGPPLIDRFQGWEGFNLGGSIPSERLTGEARRAHNETDPLPFRLPDLAIDTDIPHTVGACKGLFESPGKFGLAYLPGLQIEGNRKLSEGTISWVLHYWQGKLAIISLDFTAIEGFEGKTALQKKYGPPNHPCGWVGQRVIAFDHGELNLKRGIRKYVIYQSAPLTKEVINSLRREANSLKQAEEQARLRQESDRKRAEESL
ncbi:MAG: hypothetical protein VKP62_15845 [Candidatus Sericytochromatia bacterium]|nr:hypothetical protein [Candidatus Sericytochromatia bacterium]